MDHKQTVDIKRLGKVLKALRKKGVNLKPKEAFKLAAHGKNFMPDPSLNVHYARFEHARNTADKKYEYPVFMREWIEVKETELGLHVVKLDDVFGGGRAGS